MMENTRVSTVSTEAFSFHLKIRNFDKLEKNSNRKMRIIQNGYNLSLTLCAFTMFNPLSPNYERSNLH